MLVRKFFTLICCSLLSFDGSTSELQIIEDKDVFKSLPFRSMVENPEDKLFRSTNGKLLFFGPNEENDFFIINADLSYKQLKAPSTGKAYYAQNAFQVWYNTIIEGIHFKSKFILHLEDPLRDRFGVSYGVSHFYVYHDHISTIYSVAEPQTPLFEIEGFFTYKLVVVENVFWVFGFEYLGHEYSRTHRLIKFEKFNDRYLVMKKKKLPETYSVLDFDPYRKKILLLNDSTLAPQVDEFDFEKETFKPIGLVDEFSIYLHKSFSLNKLKLQSE